MTGWRVAVLATMVPGVAFAAGPGGVAEGFGGDDWLSKWPLLAIVLLSVVVCTTYLTILMVRGRRAARKSGEG
ncbi:hypothetical protein P6F26_14855 [Roseibacterium sp. SDUM158017]|uniref:hypothetical protein n=1 Tax=Roseicyclus salinarum TaxID=3036773 RepID=UPI002415004F|nr:hypothetical protein [Roseibacterium sp. SDUM158017]MDG4649722.1 hypothetical protein [Roseibacterium sp. SDUM158017]